MQNSRKFLGFIMFTVLVVCLVIVTGSTFSLFTDKTDSDIDINSAKVDIEASLIELQAKSISDTAYTSENAEGIVVFGNNGTEAKIENSKLTIKNFAPGDEVKVKVKIENKSSIGISYRLKIDVENTVATDYKLGDVLQFSATQGTDSLTVNGGYTDWAQVATPLGAIAAIDFTVALPVEVGNDYQGLSATVSFTIEAVQANAANIVEVATADQLYTALKINGVAVLTNNIELTKPLVIDAGSSAEIYLAGNSISNPNGDTIINNGTLTVYPGAPVTTFMLRSTPAQGSIISAKGSAIVNNGSLTIVGGNFEGTTSAITNSGETAELTIAAGNFAGDEAAIVNTEKAALTIIDGTFEGTDTAVVNTSNAVLTISGGSFKTEDENGQFAIVYDNNENVTISGGSFTGELDTEELDKIAGDGMSATKDEEGNVVFAPALFKIGEKRFTTLEEAMAAAVAGDTITIIADLNDIAIEVNKSLTFTGDVKLTNVTFNAIEGAEELTVSGLTFSGNSWINCGAASKLNVSGVTANVTPSNTAYTNSRSAFISLGRSEQHTLALTVENCNIVSLGGSDPILGWAAITVANLEGNTFGSSSDYQTNSDSVKFMAIADGATFTIKNNTVYSNYNGIVFGQNTTRDNAYSVYVDGNTFVGVADHIWIELSGGSVCHGSFNVTSNNTVNGNDFTKSDIKVHTGNIKSFSGYAGMNVVLNSKGKVTGGNLAYYGADAIATGYQVDDNGEVFANII